MLKRGSGCGEPEDGSGAAREVAESSSRCWELERTAGQLIGAGKLGFSKT